MIYLKMRFKKNKQRRLQSDQPTTVLKLRSCGRFNVKVPDSKFVKLQWQPGQLAPGLGVQVVFFFFFFK